MILESAILNVRPGLSAQFEAAFAQASDIIAANEGYITHQLHRCVENPDQYLLFPLTVRTLARTGRQGPAA